MSASERAARRADAAGNVRGARIAQAVGAALVVAGGIGFATAAWAQTVPRSTTLVSEKVEFASASRPLGQLQERRARERGEDPKPTPGDRIQAYLTRPEGQGPFPAVLLLPRCDGFTPSVQETMPQRLASWGFVTLAVDSLATRKAQDPCANAALDIFADAYGGLFYLAQLPFVDRSRIAALGVASGGRIALTLAKEQKSALVVNPEELTIKAAIAYYPECGHVSDKLALPALIMIGRDDQWARARSCEDLATRQAVDGAPIDLTVYPNVRHGFLEPDYMAGYDRTAAEDSLRRAREFLARTLGAGAR
jgi:dienelactone hydrolase